MTIFLRWWTQLCRCVRALCPDGEGAVTVTVFRSGRSVSGSPGAGQHPDSQGVCGIVMNKPSQRVEQDELRTRMRAVGMTREEIAVEFARRYRLRPRAAHRVAHGWTQQQAAGHINAHAARAGLDPEGTVAMTAPRLSELENWPVPLRRRPSPQILALLAEVYGTDIHSLLDLDDREHLTPADQLLINSMRRAAPDLPRSSPVPAGMGIVPATAAVADAVQRWPSEDLPSATHGSTGHLRPQDNAVDDRDENIVRVDSFGRRTFNILAGAAFASGVAGLDRARRVDPALVPYFEGQLDGHYQADMLLGPRALIDTVASQCGVVARLVDSADGPTRRRLAKVGSSFAAFAAWLWLDAGDPVAAFRCHDRALELAHRSGEREAVACALVDRAMAFTDLGKGSVVVDLCDGALLDITHLSPEVQVFALQQQAHGASLLGDRSQADALLDKAARLVDQVDVEVWGTACQRTAGYVDVQRATCYGRLGLADDADRLWQQIIPAAPTTARRDVGVWSARHAVVAAAQGEPERAVELARRAADIAVGTGSARARRELSAVVTVMAPWHADPIGQELVEVLAPVINEETRGDHG